MEEFWDTSPAHALLGQLDLALIEQPAHSSVILDGRIHPYRADAGGDAYLDDLFGGDDRCAFSMWNDVAGSVLDELVMAEQSGCWSTRLFQLRRTSFESFVASLGLPTRVRAWIRIVVESEIAVEWNRIAALKQIHLEPALDLMSRAAMESSAAGSYVKVIVRLRRDRVTVWDCDGEHPFPLLTDGPAGCVYLSDGRAAGRDQVLTMLIHGRFARGLNGRCRGEIVARSVRALDRLFVSQGSADPAARPQLVPLLQGVSAAIIEARVFDYPCAVAYWPHALGRSRFDHLSDALRAPHGRILIGGDTTDSSHSDGAVRAGQRMAALVAQRAGAAEAALR